MNLNTVEVATLKPDYMGFIFWQPSKRCYNEESTIIPHKIKKVGVFVDEDIQVIIKKVKKHQLLGVQLHGKESPSFCKQLKTELKGVEIIKVFSIKNEFDFSILAPFEDVCDFFLFDTKGKLPGGNGYKFNWKTLNDYPSTKPFFLSGGIGLDDADSIQEFMQQPESQYCHAIDVNSMFEIEPGLKDIEKLKDFIKRLK
nr:phosphoribosylanthranilate isomerase [Maribacter sp. HTCC2170]